MVDFSVLARPPGHTPAYNGLMMKSIILHRYSIGVYKAYRCAKFCIPMMKITHRKYVFKNAAITFGE